MRSLTLFFLVLQLVYVSISQPTSTSSPTTVDSSNSSLSKQEAQLPLFSVQIKEPETESCFHQCQQVCQSNNPATCKSAKTNCETQFKSYCQYSQDPESAEYCKSATHCDDEFIRCNSTTLVENFFCLENCIKLCPGAEEHLAKRNMDPSIQKRAMTSAEAAEIRQLASDLDVLKRAFMATSPCYKTSYVKPVIQYAKCMDPDFYNNGIGGCSRSPHSFAWPSRPADCPPGFDNIGLLCNRPGQTFWKCCTVLWAACPCPDGWTNTGCTCQIWPEVRGMDAMSCRYWAGEWLFGARCYAPCPYPGYINTGETCFRPLTTVGTDRMYCDAGMLLDRNTGFCYTPCAPGYYEVLGVCWSHCPAGTGDCGAFCVAAGTTCGEQIWRQVSSVLFTAGSIVAAVLTVGTSLPATAAVSAAKNGAMIAGRRIVAAFSRANERYEYYSTRYTQAEIAAAIANDAQNRAMSNARRTIEIVSKLIDALSTVDAFGIVELVRSFTMPLCPNLENDWEKFAMINAPPVY